MMVAIQIVFWCCIIFIVHSYALFPFVMHFLAKNKKENIITYLRGEELPKVSIVMAAYNEEDVIEQKIQSIFNTNYPIELVDVYIGSDNSTDKTDEIVNFYTQKYSNLHLVHFESRTGKPEIINQLCKKTTAEILLLTDANVFFDENTIFELVKHLKNEKIGAVGCLIKNTNVKKSGISVQEKTYLMNEFSVKHNEGLWANAVIGLFGGLYAIRKSAYCPVPAGYSVDDFYITMKVLESEKFVITSNDAICYEDVSNKLDAEFRRKIRIAVGNFKNLATFSHLANPFTKIGFMFWSHKIIRWITPLLLIFIFLLNCLLLSESCVYQLCFIGQIFLLLVIFIDFLLRKCNIHIALIRFVTHFYSMNLALLIGFLKYITGNNKNSFWQPTQRNQE